MRKRVVVTSIALVVLFAIPITSELVVSHYRRWQATKLLSVVSEFHPGITTEAQAYDALGPFARYEHVYVRGSEGRAVNEVEYQFLNFPE